MKTPTICQLLLDDKTAENITVQGWVRSFRSNRFIALNDGSTLQNLQCVVEFEQYDPAVLKQISVGAALKLHGDITPSEGSGQKYELKVNAIEVYGTSDPETYPIQPKKHSLEFLREKAHIRVRTNTFSAVMRLRSRLAFAVHQYFSNQSFCYVHTPIITGSDAEGAGEMFRVTTLSPQNPPLNEEGKVNYKEDFFGKETNLTV